MAGQLFITIRRIGKFNSEGGTPGGWRRLAPKRVVVFVAKCNLVYERRCIKRRLDEDEKG